MDKGIGHRDGKTVSAGHTTRIEGLNDLVKHLETWPEITQIRIGRIKQTKASGRGGFSFVASRIAIAGQRVTGINCHARHGTLVQHIVLCSNDLDALKTLLSNEGFGAKW